MNHADEFVAALMLVMMASSMYCFWRARRGKISYVRQIAGVNAMEEAVGRATEMGRPVGFIPGNSGIQDINTYNSMAVLSHVARIAARMHTQLIVMTSIAEVYPLIEATVHQAYMTEGVPDLFNAKRQIRFLGSDAVVFAAAVSRFVEEDKPGSMIFFGTFDFSALLLAEPGARLGVLQIAGDPSLFQMPFFVCTCTNTIIGEEFYAAGAFVNPDPKMRNSVLSQDILKLIFVSLILAGLLLMHLVRLLPQASRFVDLIKSYR